MKNILSYPIGTGFTGKEIKEWIRVHENCSDPHKAQIARYLSRFENVHDDGLYRICKGTYQSSGSFNKFLFYSKNK